MSPSVDLLDEGVNLCIRQRSRTSSTHVECECECRMRDAATGKYGKRGGTKCYNIGLRGNLIARDVFWRTYSRDTRMQKNQESQRTTIPTKRTPLSTVLSTAPASNQATKQRTTHPPYDTTPTVPLAKSQQQPLQRRIVYICNSVHLPCPMFPPTRQTQQTGNR